jgi:NTE family protein
LDQLRLTGFKTELLFSMGNLNRKQYPSSGKAYSLCLQYFDVKERFNPGTTSFEFEDKEATHQWFRLKFSAEQYFNTGIFRPGYYVEGVFSNQPFFQNYTGTIINAPGFYPLQDSRTLLLENFRAFNYIAGGLRNVFQIKNRLDFRLEGYLFKPIEYLQKNNDQEAVVIRDIRALYFAGTAGLVLHSPIGPISLNLNYYDDTENQIGVLLHAGFLLFNKHSLE